MNWFIFVLGIALICFSWAISQKEKVVYRDIHENRVKTIQGFINGVDNIHLYSEDSLYLKSHYNIECSEWKTGPWNNYSIIFREKGWMEPLGLNDPPDMHIKINDDLSGLTDLSCEIKEKPKCTCCPVHGSDCSEPLNEEDSDAR